MTKHYWHRITTKIPPPVLKQLAHSPLSLWVSENCCYWGETAFLCEGANALSSSVEQAGLAGLPPPPWLALQHLSWSSTQQACLPSCTCIYILLADYHSLSFKSPVSAGASQRQQVKFTYHVQHVKCTITSLDSSLIFFQKCDTKLDDDLAKMMSEDSAWQQLPFPALALQTPPGNPSQRHWSHSSPTSCSPPGLSIGSCVSAWVWPAVKWKDS